MRAGETKTVTLQLKISDLAIVKPDCTYEVESGDFEIMVGRNTKENLKAVLKVK
ncbi:MAG: fibronectin type III-like domain-contianing protein [Clostridia bacterium]|nr:fibronectin type III-like domain-contianing protein [Clostridia bacterium]